MKTIVTPMKKLYALAALVFMMFATVNANAQTGFDDDVDDQTPSQPNPQPINGYVYAGVLAAGIIGYTATRQKKATV